MFGRIFITAAFIYVFAINALPLSDKDRMINSVHKRWQNIESGYHELANSYEQKLIPFLKMKSEIHSDIAKQVTNFIPFNWRFSTEKYITCHALIRQQFNEELTDLKEFKELEYMTRGALVLSIRIHNIIDRLEEDIIQVREFIHRFNLSRVNIDDTDFHNKVYFIQKEIEYVTLDSYKPFEDLSLEFHSVAYEAIERSQLLLNATNKLKGIIFSVKTKPEIVRCLQKL